MKKITIGAIVLIIIIGGWFLLRSDTPPITKLTTAEASSINASVTLSPEQPTAGEPTTVTLSFTNSDGTPVGNLMTHHARRVHVLLISEDLNSIGHIHPDDFGNITQEVIQSGTYSVEYAFPRAGRYIIGVDVMTSDDTLAQQFIVNVRGGEKMGRITKDLSLEKCFQDYTEDSLDQYTSPVFTDESQVECPSGYKITMTPSVETISAGEEVRLSYHVEKGGAPVTDLSPYLNAAIHFAIVPESFDTLLHRHGDAVMGSAMAMGDSMEHVDHMETEDGHMAMEKESMEMENLEGIHIMSDGSVMLGDGTVLHDASVTHEGKIKLGSGKMVEPVMDLRSGDSMADIESMGHHHGSVPESFGPGLVSESIVFPAAGLYQIFAQVKHEGNIIFSSFMVEVEEGFNAANARVIDLRVANKTLAPEIVTLTEGDKAILRVSTDETGEFHIAGYEIEKEMTVGEIAEVRFTANLPGRYNLELHPEGTGDDIEIGALVVNPK